MPSLLTSPPLEQAAPPNLRTVARNVAAPDSRVPTPIAAGLARRLDAAADNLVAAARAAINGVHDGLSIRHALGLGGGFALYAVFDALSVFHELGAFGGVDRFSSDTKKARRALVADLKSETSDYVRRELDYALEGFEAALKIHRRAEGTRPKDFTREFASRCVERQAVFVVGLAVINELAIHVGEQRGIASMEAATTAQELAKIAAEHFDDVRATLKIEPVKPEFTIELVANPEPFEVDPADVKALEGYVKRLGPAK